jgi:hypothetical protein
LENFDELATQRHWIMVSLMDRSAELLFLILWKAVTQAEAKFTQLRMID